MTTREFNGNRKLEFSSREEIGKVQEELLQDHVHYLADRSPYYRALFKAQGLDPVDDHAAHPASGPVHGQDDRWASTTMIFWRCRRSEIVDMVLSSGTTGKPTTMMYTERDLQRLAYNEEISFASCGMTKDDVVLLTCTLDRCFIAGLAYFSGVRSLGAAAIRNGLSSFESHFEIIKRLRPTILVGVPSFLLKLGTIPTGAGHRPRVDGDQKIDMHRRADPRSEPYVPSDGREP